MDRHGLADDPLWWSPFAGIDSPLHVDPLLAATGQGTGTGVAVTLQYASEASVTAHVTCPGPGILRLTIGTPDLALRVDPQQLHLTQATADTVRIEGPGVTGALGPGGLGTTVLTRPGGLRFVADQEALPIADLAAVSGRLLRGEEHVGWSESIALATDSAIYGGGENFQALTLRGRRRTLLNRETNTATGRDLAYLNVPFLWSTSGWAVLVNTGGMVGVDAGASQQETLSMAVAGHDLDLLTFTGSPAQILTTYWNLTGRPGEVPDWAFGVWLSRATFISEAEVEHVLDELEAADALPDVVHVDGWLEGNVFRTFTCEWRGDRARFPNGWTDRLRRRGVRSSVWLNPFVLAGSETGEELRERGLLLRRLDGTPAATADRDNRWIVDFTNPQARDWWHERVAGLLAEEAPDALKLDFAEEIPLDAVCHDGRSGAAIRNAYARMYQSATHEALGALRPGQHVPMFCRSGTHGAQRNPCHWVGDSPATWDGLAAALFSVQSLALSGFGIVAHDAGGFISPGTGDIPTQRLDGLDVPFTAEVDPELYTRWVQWGAVTPFMRLHGLGLREPTAYPEPFRSAAIAAFRLRRRLLGYLAHAYRMGLAEGLPLLRPMVLQLPEDRAARAADLQHFLGPDVLVAPLLAAGGSREFYLPEGPWVNLFDGAREDGHGWVRRTFPIGAFPAYARSGAPVAAAAGA